MSPSNPPCAACKLKRQKCTKECVFAPYFPPDQPKKFASIYEVFGAKNIAKLLNELNAEQRQDAVNSLAYEAEERLRNPVYGCVGLISILQLQLKQIHSDLQNARTELATYIGPQAVIPMIHQATPFMPQAYIGASSSSTMIQHQHGMMPLMGIQTAPVHGGSLIIREPQQQLQHPHQVQQHHHLRPHHHQQQLLEAQLAILMGAPIEQHDMIRASEQQQQYQHQQVQKQQTQRQVFFNCEFEASGSGSVTATGFNQIGPSQPNALGPYDNPYQIEPQQQLQTQLLFEPQQGNQLLQFQTQQEQQMTQDTYRRTESDEERRSEGPSC